jgi:hypothetical protein
MFERIASPLSVHLLNTTPRLPRRRSAVDIAIGLFLGGAALMLAFQFLRWALR